MKQKLIFLDIDGTLLPPGEMLIPQSTVEALHKAHANGHKLFLCTGRNRRMTQPLLDYGFDGAVCSAGGYVFCGDKVLVDLPMEPQLAQGVRSAMERHLIMSFKKINVMVVHANIFDIFCNSHID